VAVTADETGALAGMDKTFRRAASLMKRLGLTFSVWDHEGQGLAGLHSPCGLCRILYGRSAPCLRACAAQAGSVCDGGKSVQGEANNGACRTMCVPLRKRRRTVGIAVVCYPSTRWLDEEFLARQCDAMHLDRQVVAEAARLTCRHTPEEADDLLRGVEWALDADQALDTANQELVTLSTNLSSTYEELSLLYTISGSMKVTQQPDEFLRGVCREVREVMNVSAAAAVVYAHPPAAQEDLVVVDGDADLGPVEIKQLALGKLAPQIAQQHGTIVANQFVWRSSPELGRRVRNLTAAPLVGEEPLGMLLAINKNAGEFDSADLKLIGSIANQSAVFMANSMLYADLEDLLMGVLHALTASIDAKDPYTCGHSNRVAIISRRLAEECGLAPEKVQQIYLTGLLHDIGKIGVPESTLRKPGRLTDEEYESIKKHPGIGAKILGGIRQLDDAIPGILSHHERLDGKGYPQGLRGDQVPQDARIIGLADCFDAMTSDRIYRKAMPLETVLEEIRTCAGTQFDAEIARKFLSLDLEGFLEELRQPAQTVFPVAVGQETAP